MQNLSLTFFMLLSCMLNVISLTGQVACEDPECITQGIDLSTGVDHLNGNALYPVGALDDYWEITSSPNGPLGQATVINPDPNWMPGFGTGQWVSINTTGMAPAANPTPAVPYTFQRCFCNCQNDFWIDDLTIFAAEQISEVRLNGSAVYSNTTNVYDPLEASDGIQIPTWAFGGNGTFCLEVDIRKLTTEDTPIGLLVSATVSGIDLLREECCDAPPPPNNCDMLPAECRTDFIDLTTGLNPDGSLININGTNRDPFWQIIQEPNGNLAAPYNPFVVNPTPGWNAIAPGQWLSPMANNLDSPGNVGVMGVYTYERCVCTCDEGLVNFDFTAFGDNFINSIRVDNNVLYTRPPGVAPSAHFMTGVPIVSTLNLPAGQHCLQVDIMNTGRQTGFKLDGGASGATLLSDSCCVAPPPVECCEVSDEATIYHEDFDPGFTGANTDYTQGAGTLNPGEYDFINSAQASTLSNGTWNVVGHTNCDPTEQFMAINGNTGGTGMAVVYESANLPLAANEMYNLCMSLKHLPQCAFDVNPEIQVQLIEITFAGNNTIFQTSQTLGLPPLNNTPCGYETIEVPFTSNGASPFSIYRLQVLLNETGVGDGNDFAIDDVIINRFPPSSDDITRFTSSRTPLGNGLVEITATAQQSLPDGCSAVWEIWEVTDRDNPSTTRVPGTYARGDAAAGWGDSHNFPGYCCAPVLGGSPGVFQEDLHYQILRTVECDCETPNVWEIISTNGAGFAAEDDSASLINAGDKLSVSPNPFNDGFILRLPTVLEERATAQITSISGDVVKELQLQAGELETTIDMTDLPAGIYILQTQMNDKFYSTKLIKQ